MSQEVLGHVSSQECTRRRKPKDQSNPNGGISEVLRIQSPVEACPPSPQESKSTELYKRIEPNFISELQDNLLKAKDVELK
jgi:hypothetical protein